LRPSKAESHAVLRMLKLQRLANCSMHFCHLTLPSSLRQVSMTNARRVSTEVTPHHLFLSRKDLKRSGWRAWMVPPLRSKQVVASLLKMTLAGKVSLIASDHAPHSIVEKREEPATSPPGVPGLETTLPLLLTLVNKGVLSLERLVELLSSNPAKLFHLRRKGKLAEGADGDVVLVDLRKRGKVESKTFFSKAKYSPFEGMKTIGAVRTTVVGGRIVYDQGQIVSEPGTGRVLRRGR
jgi:dihydroorotase